MSVIDDYLQNIEPDKRKQLERIRYIARLVVPDANEIISYRMPTMQYKGISFLGFYAFTNHIGVFPFGGEEIEKFKDQLKDFKLSKGTIRVPYDHPISEKLLTKIIQHRLQRIENQK